MKPGHINGRKKETKTSLTASDIRRREQARSMHNHTRLRCATREVSCCFRISM